MNWKDQRILVVGLARSGMAAIDALHKRGARLTAYDRKSLEEMAEQNKTLQERGIPVFAAELPPINHEAYDLVVVSPGVPLDVSPVKEAIQVGIPVIGELELSYRLKAPAVQMHAVTGTNGKTTTTALLLHLLQSAGIPAAAGGNIGTALCSIVDNMSAGMIAVEASSFQLDTIKDFHPPVCAILNITPDHLDRHKTMEHYIEAKARVFQNQDAEDLVVLNYEDPIVRNLARRAPSRVIFFSNQRTLQEGVFVQDQMICCRYAGETSPILPVSELRLRGKHNLENVVCAVAMAKAAGVSMEIIRDALPGFKGIRHRMEEVAEHNGVLYINDSKGTNPNSTIKALEALEQPIILIAGGRAKGGSFKQLAMVVRERVKELILLGKLVT